MKCLEKGETFLFLLLFPAIPETGIWKKKETWDHEEKYHHLYEKIVIPASVFKIISTNHQMCIRDSCGPLLRDMESAKKTEP